MSGFGGDPGPYCLSEFAFPGIELWPYWNQISCPPSLYSSAYNCTESFSSINGGVALHFAQNVTSNVVTVPQATCVQLNGLPNSDCNATSALLRCRSSLDSPSTCLRRSLKDGSCLNETETQPSTIFAVTNEGQCMIIGNSTFNCEPALMNPCKLPDGSVSQHNCSAICNTPSLLFESVTTFKYCVAQAIERPFSSDQLITTDSSRSILNLTNACMQQYCDVPSPELGGPCPYQNYTTMEDFVLECPQNVTIRLNSDVGGVGITISYLMQIAISLYFWIMLRGYQTVQSLKLRLPKFFNDHVLILRSALVEFQEAQVFFVMAAQISIITILSRRLGTFESYSTVQSDWNNHFLTLIESAGLYTLTLPLLLLQSAEMVSWYILILSLLSATLTLVSLAFSRGHKFPDVITSIPQAAYLDRCGGNSPPIALCPALQSISENDNDHTIWVVSGDNSTNPVVTSENWLTASVQSYERTQNSYTVPIAPWNIGMVAFWFIVIVGLLLIKACLEISRSREEKRDRGVNESSNTSVKIASTPRSETELENPNTSPSASNSDTEGRGERVWELFLYVLCLLLECIAVGMMISVVVVFRNWRLSGVMTLTDWSIGQVVALFVWAPAISKYLYWSAFGMKGHSNVRIAKPYHITKASGA